MAVDGFRIATAFVDIVADSSQAKQDVRNLDRDLGPDVDKAGQKLGERLGNGLVRDASGRIRNARGQFASAAELALAGIDPVAEKRGKESGGKLAQGFRMSFIRNSPLIVAAIAGGLAAGAPLVAAGAATLMAGIGVVAAAQSQAVQSAWLGTWQEIRRGAIADAAVLIPTLTGIATRVGDAFERLRPQMREAFEGSRPLIDDLADGLIELGENAMPGFLDVIRTGGPVFDGLRSFLADTGTGVSEFLSVISRHAPAAGKAFEALGDIIGHLLPILGQFLGSGAEVAAVMLPILARALGVVADVLEVLEPILPLIVTGFIGMKIAQTAAGWVTSLSTSLRDMAQHGIGVSQVGTAVSGLAAGVGIAMMAIQDSEQQTREWASALNEGGEAARNATEEMRQHAEATSMLESGWGRLFTAISPVGGAFGVYADDVDKAEQANREYLASLTPMEAAQRNVRIAQEELSRVVGEYGPKSQLAVAAQKDLAAAQAEAARVAGEEEQAIRGVTEAMIAQTEVIFSRADADLALRNSIDAQEDAFRSLNEAIKENGRASEEADDAGRAWEGALNDQVDAARRLAEEALPAMLDQQSKTALSNFAALDVLKQLEAQYGDRLPAAVRDQIAALEAAVGTYDRGQLEAQAMTADLQELGQQKPKPEAQLGTTGFMSPFHGLIGSIYNLHAQRPTPQAQFGTGGFMGPYGGMINAIYNLHRQRPTPLATLIASTGAAEQWLNWTARDRTSYVTQIFRAIGSPFSGGFGWGATGGRVLGPTIGFDDGGKVRGPGGPTDDLVRVLGPDPFADYRLSNLEWVIKAASAMRYGDEKMQAVNEGTAEIIVPQQRFADGGTPGSSGAGMGGPRELHVHLNGTFDFSDPASIRRIAPMLRDAIRDEEMAYR